MILLPQTWHFIRDYWGHKRYFPNGDKTANPPNTVTFLAANDRNRARNNRNPRRHIRWQDRGPAENTTWQDNNRSEDTEHPTVNQARQINDLPPTPTLNWQYRGFLARDVRNLVGVNTSFRHIFSIPKPILRAFPLTRRPKPSSIMSYTSFIPCA